MSRAVVALALAYLLHFASGGIQMPLLTDALVAAGFSVGGIGLMWSARNLAMAFAPAVWGALADRWGSSRPFLVATLAFSAILMIALAFAKTEAQGLVLFALFGLLAAPSGSLLDGATLKTLGAAREKFGRVRVFGTIGVGATALLFGWLVESGRLPCRGDVLFPIAGGFSALAIVALLSAPAPPRTPRARGRSALGILKKRRVALLIAGTALLWASHGGYSSFLGRLGAAHGAGPQIVTQSIFVAIVAEVIAFAVVGRLLVRFGPRALLVACAAVAVARWAALASTASTGAFVALQALHGFTFGLSYPTAVALLAEDVDDDQRQSAQGLFASLAFGVGGSGGAIVAGYALEHGGAAACWVAMAALAAASIVVVALLDPPRARPPG